MPLSSATSSVPQRWVICVLCSLVVAETTFRDICFFETNGIVEYFSNIANTTRKDPGAHGCPHILSGCQWKRKELPFYLPDVYWNPSILDMALSAFQIGKFLITVPAGLLSDLGYSRYVLGGGMFLVTSITMLLPTTAELGATAFVISSIVEGIGEGMILPSVITLIRHWTPPVKRNTFTVLVIAGLYYGNILGHIFFNQNYKKSNSWSYGKYSNGSFGIIWLIFWFIFGYHSPLHSPFDSKYDQFIATFHRTLAEELDRLQKIPWKKIVSSRSFLSVILLYCCFQWIVYANIGEILEDYELYILHFSEEFSEGSSIAVIAGLPTSLMGGFLADRVVEQKYISRTAIKKIFVFISIILSSVFIVSATFVGCNYILFWIMTTTAVYVVGLADSAIFTSPIDLSPRYAGLLMGMMVGARTLLSLVNLNIAGIMTTDIYDPYHWQLKSIFNVLSAIIFTIPFFVFGSAKKLKWDRSLSRSTTN